MPTELTPEQLVARIPYLAELPEGARDDVGRAWRRRPVAAGTVLFLEGEPTAGLYAVATRIVTAGSLHASRDLRGRGAAPPAGRPRR